MSCMWLLASNLPTLTIRVSVTNASVAWFVWTVFASLLKSLSVLAQFGHFLLVNCTVMRRNVHHRQSCELLRREDAELLASKHSLSTVPLLRACACAICFVPERHALKMLLHSLSRSSWKIARRYTHTWDKAISTSHLQSTQVSKQKCIRTRNIS